MKASSFLVLTTLFTFGVHHSVSAQNQSTENEIAAGKAKSVVCAACHSVDGNSQIPSNPKLAGQHKTYLVKQLNEYKLAIQTGEKEGRSSPIMGGMASFLTDEDVQNVASYFSSQTPTESKQKTPTNLKAQTLFNSGDINRKIPACVSCHGPKGNGSNLSGFPDISGQHAQYTLSQLKAFRSGTRLNDKNGMMQSIAAKLTDEDIEVLANYISSLD
ncbi:cytochrome c [Alteromonas sp. 5E99-2]|uniref:c-type cytochrome n=1 Tax=Alteromonas sp. 5E99-2 TaxID=2817683 RepID=UPI001A990D4C|nr:cytochrome c [Alteromonas sp. 5E99-2]MBO1256800.1 cytochrome c [Alteromonas sp. 5E99-2]